MREDRGEEKRWYQKPEFIWTIATFLLLQGIQAWRSSNQEAAKSAVQALGTEDLKRTFDGFKTSIFERLASMDKNQQDAAREQRELWQKQHDDVNNIGSAVATQRKDFDGFVQRDESEKQLLQTKIDNARERLIGLEKLLQEARR